MAHLKASTAMPPTAMLSRGSFRSTSVPGNTRKLGTRIGSGAGRTYRRLSIRYRGGGKRGFGGIEAAPSSAGEVWSASGGEELGQRYLVTEYGWGVRRLTRVGEEVRVVAHIQAEAFHEPLGLFDDFFFQFFEADVLQALIYRMRSSPPDRYACLVAEPMDASNLLSTSLQGLVGVVDVSIQRDGDVLKHLEGVEEYLYVSGIAVLKSFSHLVLHAYEDDEAAQELYSKAGYKVVSGDPWWVNPRIGKRRRVLMIKQSSLWDWC